MPEKKKGEKLNDFTPNEFEDVKKQVAALTGQIALIMDNNKVQKERIDALAELYSDVNDKVGAVVEKTYPGDIATAIREIRDVLSQPQGEVVRTRPDETPTPTLNLSNLPSQDQLNVMTSGDVTVIQAKKFLGDLWGPVNDAVKALGGTWIRDGQNSRWEIGGAVASKPTQPRGKPQIKDPDAPATEKQVAFLKKLKVYIKPDLSKGEASKLIDSKLGERNNNNGHPTKGQLEQSKTRSIHRTVDCGRTHRTKNRGKKVLPDQTSPPHRKGAAPPFRAWR
jgi:hypothetical protein